MLQSKPVVHKDDCKDNVLDGDVGKKVEVYFSCRS